MNKIKANRSEDNAASTEFLGINLHKVGIYILLFVTWLPMVFTISTHLNKYENFNNIHKVGPINDAPLLTKLIATVLMCYSTNTKDIY